MSRVDITLGLLASIATIAVMAVYGLREEDRLVKASAGWHNRSIESGALLYDQLCVDCHGENAVGGLCPPLDETSGLYGGDLGVSVACRLEELGWDPTDPYNYIVSVIESGRQYSTRPERYQGNRVAVEEPGRGTPTALPVMAMPPWGEKAGGPLRGDQIRDIANYLVNFRSALPAEADDIDAIRETTCGPLVRPATGVPATATALPTATDDPEAVAATGTAAADDVGTGGVATGTPTP